MSNISQNEVEFSFNGKYLSQLKWLYFFRSQIKQLTQAMEHFSNLNVLQLIDCGELDVLPKAIGTLVWLQTLYLNSYGRLTCLPETIGSLVNFWM
jgi:Leucine-rich repeat (LRR) protein